MPIYSPEEEGRLNRTQERTPTDGQMRMGGLVEAWRGDRQISRLLEQYPLGFKRKAKGNIDGGNLFELTTAMINYYRRFSPEAARLAMEGGVNALKTFLDLNNGKEVARRDGKGCRLMEALAPIGSGVAAGVEYQLCPTGESELFSSKGFLLQDLVVAATGMDPLQVPRELRRFKPISPILVAQNEQMDRGRLQIYESLLGSFVKALNGLEAGLAVTADPNKLRERDVRQNRKVFFLGDVLVNGGLGTSYDYEGEEAGVLADMDTPLGTAFWYWRREGSSSVQQYPDEIKVVDSGSGKEATINCRSRRGTFNNTVGDLVEKMYGMKREALVTNLNRLEQMVVVLSNMVTRDMVLAGIEDPKLAEQSVRVLHGSWILALLTAWRKGYDEKMTRLKLAGA